MSLRRVCVRSVGLALLTGAVISCGDSAPMMTTAAQPAAVLPDPTSPRANITIAQNQINPDTIEGLLGKIAAIRATADQSGEVGLAEILSFLPATDDERAAVLAAHPGAVPVNCSGDICTAVSRGSEVYVTLSQLENLPAWFGSTITLKLRWRGPSQLELCRVENFQVKKVFWVNVDGAFIDARGGEGSSFVDVSWGGNYPDC